MRKPAVLVHHLAYQTDLKAFGITTPFALDRGEKVLEALEKEFSCKIRSLKPRPLCAKDLELVHTREYIESLDRNETWAEIFGLNLQRRPKTRPTRELPELLGELLLKSGGTLLAGRLALKYGLAANLGAGYHHAFADHGEGYCAINDIAITIRWLQKQNLIKTALVVDVDFHQGNGTAAIFAGDDSVATFSIHSAEAFPEVKQKSTVDIEIKHNQSHTYLARFKTALKRLLNRFRPDICIFVQGADAHEKDAATKGLRMRLTLEELELRDKFVIDACADRKIPLALVFAGGYGPEAWRVHFNAVRHLVSRAWNKK